MKRIFIFSVLMIAFVMNAVAQWNEDPIIRETHWFGQYEYVDIQPGFVQRKINWSGNYIESTEIWRGSTGGGQLAHQPKTSFYSWLENELRFSVENPEAWKIRGTTNTAYNPKGFRDFDTDGECGGGGGQGLRNTSGSNQNFYIHNLKAGDSYDVRYYLDGGNSESHITGSATGTATVSIPANAVIRNVVITLAEYQASDFKVEEVSNVSDITSSYAGYANLQTSNFGDLGYRYSFKHAGVLEDKHGAVPYMTMSFGNDNDMTFVRKVSSHSISSGSETINHVPGQQGIQVYAKNRGQQDPSQPTAAYLGDNYYYQVTNDPNNASNNPNDANNAWDCQFWIGSPELKNLPAGAVVTVHFRCNAGHAISAVAQAHGPNAGNYIYTDNLFTAEIAQESWNVLEYTFTVSEAMAGTFQYIAFNLNDNSYNTFKFAEIQLVVPHTEEQQEGDEEYVAASIINEHNELDPTKKRLQYPWTYKNNNNYQDPFSKEEIKDRFVGKEWSTFTAEEDPTHTVRPENNSQWVNDEEYVFGDRFNSIWPLCGNFFYFFPEVDGLLEVEYYCEGSNEVAAFWYKQKENGDYVDGSGQPKTQFINTNSSGDSNTNGRNNYKLRVNVEKGGIYYLCSLPTNLHQQPIIRLKSYTFVPRFRVAPLYKVVSNTEVANENAAIQKVAEITGGPYNDLDGTDHGYESNAYDLASNTFTRNAEQEPRIKCLGNVVSAKAKVEYDGTKQWLSFYDIKFREGTNPETGEAYNPGGAVVAHVNNGMGQASFVLTIAYDAANAKWNDAKDTRVAATSRGKEVKRWDFYSGKGDYITKRDGAISYNGGDTYTTEVNSGWDLGKYGKDDGTRYATAPSDWVGKSKLFKEVHKADGLTTDWEHDYVDVPNKKEPIFKSIYDMEADNADMIHETAGLVFFTEPNELGIYNENEAPTSSFQDRFIGLMGGGKLIIPRLKENDRVVIKMGCFGNVAGIAENSDFEQKAILNITNAKDAKGTPITGDYVIGGSTPFADETSPANTQPHGEYHFIVNQTSTSDDTDFAIEVKEAGLLKIYSIAIYCNAANNNADILTENSVSADDGPEILLTDADESKDMNCHLRYFGYKEKSEFDGNISQIRGNLTNLTNESFSTVEPTTEKPWYSVSTTFNKGDFGSFHADMDVKTRDDYNTYVTDYAPGTLAVGYRETKTYPYTWDFTDLLTVSNGYVLNAIGQEEQAQSSSLLPDNKGWIEDSGSCLRNAPEKEPGILFANGGQLYASNKMFAETAGLGFKRSTDNVDDAKKQNKSVAIVSGATGTLKVDNPTDQNEFTKIVVPQVDANAAIYVRATPVPHVTPKAKYSFDGENATILTASDVFNDDNDKVYVMKNDGDKRDVELWLNGLSIKKIAVSTYNKTVNAKGWATESREKATDPTLTSYMTGKDIRTYIVSKVEYSKKEVTLERIDAASDISNFEGYLMPAAEDGDNHACILLNCTGRENGSIKGAPLNIIDGGFHLFVPDMHDVPDETKATWEGVNKTNLLVSVVDPRTEDNKIPAINADGTFNYAFTCKYYDIDPESGKITGSLHNDAPQAFYRIATGQNGVEGDEGGATSKGHQGYLPINTSTVQGGGNVGARFNIMIVDGGEVTGISTLESVAEDNDRYFNLSGQQLSGKPNRSGLYIVNGKKVYIKNK